MVLRTTKETLVKYKPSYKKKKHKQSVWFDDPEEVVPGRTTFLSRRLRKRD